jgi:hypothetical protein
MEAFQRILQQRLKMARYSLQTTLGKWLAPECT